jgi:hypothetical protein
MDNLYKLCDDELWKKLSDKKGGVYKIIAIRDGKIVPQHRFLGTDPDGILYIGKATSYIDRVIGLVKSISPKYNGNSHICGRRYKSNVNIAKLFPFDTLHLDIIPSNEPEVIENKLLKEYFEKFGEAPPLNAHY